jgi:hypothetical protein
METLKGLNLTDGGTVQFTSQAFVDHILNLAFSVRAGKKIWYSM